ncbi:unnamed protein product, partial [Closterium sp. NIES-54]
MVTTTTPGGQRVSICTCARTGRHLATFTRRPGSSLYTLTAEPPQVAASAQVSASGPVAPPCLCHLVSHQTLLWHHRLGHPSLPRLRGMHSRLLISGLPRSLPPLPPSPAPPCLPCVEGRQRAAPHSSSFPPTNAPLETLHMDVWGPSRIIGQDRERYFLLLCERFRHDLLVLRLHSERGGEFSSDLLREFCPGEGILQSFTLPASPQQNGIAEHHIGLVMEVARTSMIHAAAPHFLWPFAVQYAAHQLNLWPCVSLLETSPTLRWTAKVGDASMFRVWGSCAFVRDTSADKLSTRAIPCVILGFPPDAPGWQFYHPTSHHVLPSQDITFDESVRFYRLFPYRSAPLPPLPLFLAPGPPPVDPLPPQDSGAARGAEPARAEPGGAEPAGADPGGVESEGAGFGGAELAGAEPRGAEPEGMEPGGAESEGAESGGAEPRGAASSGCPVVASPRLSPRPKPLSPQQLREWFARRTRLWSGAAGAGDSAAGGTGAGGAGAAGPRAGARDPGACGTGAGGIGAIDPGARGTRAAGAGGVGGAGAGGVGAGGTGAGGTGAGGAGAGGAGAGDPSTGGVGADDPGSGGAGAGGAASGGTGAGGTPDSLLPPPSLYAEQTDSFTERHEPEYRPSSPAHAVFTGRRVPRLRPPLVPSTHVMALCPSSIPLRVPLPPPPESSLPAVPDPVSELAHAASPTVFTGPSFESIAASALVAELGDFAAACRLDYATSLVAESESDCPPSVEGECALGTEVLEDRQEDFEYLVAAVPHLVTMFLAPEGDPDAPDIPTTRSYAEAITVPPPEANIVNGMWIFRMKRPPGSPLVFKARYVARGFSQRQGVEFFHTFSPSPKMTTLRVLLHVAAQRDYELHSLDFSTAFLQGSMHEEIWLRRPPGFTGSFPAGTKWSLRRPVHGLRQAPREWHDTLRTTVSPRIEAHASDKRRRLYKGDGAYIRLLCITINSGGAILVGLPVRLWLLYGVAAESICCNLVVKFYFTLDGVPPVQQAEIVLGPIQGVVDATGFPT